jgi:hypothetical protein
MQEGQNHVMGKWCLLHEKLWSEDAGRRRQASLLLGLTLTIPRSTVHHRLSGYTPLCTSIGFIRACGQVHQNLEMHARFYSYLMGCQPAFKVVVEEFEFACALFTHTRSTPSTTSLDPSSESRKKVHAPFIGTSNSPKNCKNERGSGQRPPHSAPLQEIKAFNSSELPH